MGTVGSIVRSATAAAVGAALIATGACGGDDPGVATGAAPSEQSTSVSSDLPVSDETPVSDDGAGSQTQSAVEGATGTVTSSSGGPIVGALVVPRGLDANSPAVPEIALYTDAEGRYVWSLPPGQWELTVTADGFRSETKTVAVAQGALAVLDFTLSPA